MPNSVNDVLRSLLLERSTAALATLADGRPAASMIPFAVHIGPDGVRLVTHVSGLAGHTRGMLACPEVCLLVTAPESVDAIPQAIARVSLPALATFIPEDHPEWETLKSAYLAKFPQAADLFQLGDFSLVAFVPGRARLVAGFARAVSLDPDAVAAALA
ncbi:MAG: pyridoxamine 5'-phosphate oxidase family protein [Planctomycetaceae bacterium]